MLENEAKSSIKQTAPIECTSSRALIWVITLEISDISGFGSLIVLIIRDRVQEHYIVFFLDKHFLMTNM